MAPSTLSKLCSPSLPDRRDGFAEDNVFLEENWNIHCLITAPLLWLSVGSSREREEGKPCSQNPNTIPKLFPPSRFSLFPSKFKNKNIYTFRDYDSFLVLSAAGTLCPLSFFDHFPRWRLKGQSAPLMAGLLRRNYRLLGSYLSEIVVVLMNTPCLFVCTIFLGIACLSSILAPRGRRFFLLFPLSDIFLYCAGS